MTGWPFIYKRDNVGLNNDKYTTFQTETSADTKYILRRYIMTAKETLIFSFLNHRLRDISIDIIIRFSLNAYLPSAKSFGFSYFDISDEFIFIKSLLLFHIVFLLYRSLQLQLATLRTCSNDISLRHPYERT